MAKRALRVIHPTDKVRVTFGAGDEYRYLATGADTDGEYFLVEAIVPPGGGPPSHIQTREEEAFYILEGELTFYSEDGEIIVGPGAYLNIPKGAKHQFRNNTDQTAKSCSFLLQRGLKGYLMSLPIWMSLQEIWKQPSKARMPLVRSMVSNIFWTSPAWSNS